MGAKNQMERIANIKVVGKINNEGGEIDTN